MAKDRSESEGRVAAKPKRTRVRRVRHTPGPEVGGGDAVASGATLILEVSNGSERPEVFVLDPALRQYRDEFSAQLDEVVLPGVLARILKGATSIAPADLARRMLAVAPAPAPVNKMAEQVGPDYYDTDGVATILAKAGANPISKQAIEHRRRRHTILALRTSDGRWVYPTWQFRDHGILPGLADVLTTFHAATAGHDGSENAASMSERRSDSRLAPFSEWSVGTWLTTAREDLGGLTAVEWLEAGRERDHLLTLVRRTAAAWVA